MAFVSPCGRSNHRSLKTHCISVPLQTAFINQFEEFRVPFLLRCPAMYEVYKINTTTLRMSLSAFFYSEHLHPKCGPVAYMLEMFHLLMHINAIYI